MEAHQSERQHVGAVTAKQNSAESTPSNPKVFIGWTVERRVPPFVCLPPEIFWPFFSSIWPCHWAPSELDSGMKLVRGSRHPEVSFLSLIISIPACLSSSNRGGQACFEDHFFCGGSFFLMLEAVFKFDAYLTVPHSGVLQCLSDTWTSRRLWILFRWTETLK